MYTQVASKLAIGEGGTEYSQAVSMSGGNAVEVEATAFAVTTNVRITIEESNDLQNWTEVGSGPHVTLTTAARYGHDQEDSIAGAYVRLRYTATGGTGIVAAGINVANL